MQHWGPRAQHRARDEQSAPGFLLPVPYPESFSSSPTCSCLSLDLDMTSSCINLQQTIVCSARKMRSTSSTSSTLGASGTVSGEYGLGPDPRCKALRDGNWCTACVLVERLPPWYASVQETFCQLYSKLRLSFTLSECPDSV